MLHMFPFFYIRYTLLDLKANRGNCGSWRKNYEWKKRFKNWRTFVKYRRSMYP